LSEVLGRGFERVVLDLREVSFIDSTGLRAVLEIDSAGRAAGVEFAMVPGPAGVQRIFDLTGTDAALRFITPADIERA
jgi:anti-anti-sigma factor